MSSARLAAHRPRRGRLALAFLVLATSIASLGMLASGAGAAGDDPYSLDAEALFSPAATDLTLRVDGPIQPSVLESVQVKAWPRDGGGAQTRNFFDVPSPGGVATIPLTGRDRGERLEVRVHLEVRPQHNLDAETIILRRPDLTVTQIDVPEDVVRTRTFDVSVMVAQAVVALSAEMHGHRSLVPVVMGNQQSGLRITLRSAVDRHDVVSHARSMTQALESRRGAPPRERTATRRR